MMPQRPERTSDGVVVLTKMHGTENDFVIVDVRTQRVSGLPGFARRVCDRHTGVGADGVIVLAAPDPAGVATIAMRVINADGSEAEMCGNGIRCAARWLHEAGEGDVATFETAAGNVRTEIVATEPEYLVRVAMGCPVAERLDGDADAWFVDLGNPHVVLMRRSADDPGLGSYARALQSDVRFPNGTNVHMAVPREERLDVRHWERGVGPTRSCGTGVVASAAVAAQLWKHRRPIEVRVPGGRLTVEWDADGNALLIGPAVRVFDTAVSRDAFDRP
jgi:diaminopimelate epimerase